MGRRENSKSGLGNGRRHGLDVKRVDANGANRAGHDARQGEGKR